MSGLACRIHCMVFVEFGDGPALPMHDVLTACTYRRVPHHQLVIWADSKDIVWLPCGRDMRQIFKEFDHDIVIGSCPFQYPDQFKEELFPDVPVMKPEIEFTEESNKTYYEYKYINAGFIMGRAGALIHYLGGSFLRYGAVDTVDYFNDQA